LQDILPDRRQQQNSKQNCPTSNSAGGVPNMIIEWDIAEN